MAAVASSAAEKRPRNADAPYNFGASTLTPSARTGAKSASYADGGIIKPRRNTISVVIPNDATAGLG